MRRAAAYTVIFFFAAPAVMAWLVPWLITGFDRASVPWGALDVLGVVLAVLGLAAVLECFVRFVREGVGTPAPVAPTEFLVQGGLYRHLRNPMYVAVIAVILGQAAMLGRPVLLVYAAIFWLVVASFVRVYEEPTLSRRYGEQYDAYRRSVRGWWP